MTKHVRTLTDDLIRLSDSIKQATDRDQRYLHGVVSGIVGINQKLRLAGNYELSDEIRAMLNDVGIVIVQGTAGIPYDKIPINMKNRTVNDSWEFDDKKVGG